MAAPFLLRQAGKGLRGGLRLTKAPGRVFEPRDAAYGVARLLRRLVDFALADFHQFGRALLTGAIVVAPLAASAALSLWPRPSLARRLQPAR